MLTLTQWTQPRDAQLCRLRAEGATWDEIAADLNVTRDVARERGRRLGARRPPADHVRTVDPDRPPFSPGHPISWAVITEGTSLEGTVCVWPPNDNDDVTDATLNTMEAQSR